MIILGVDAILSSSNRNRVQEVGRNVECEEGIAHLRQGAQQKSW
jgi:hypothetical protein